jgi:uncharacterized phage protein (TIGR01671 family)
MNKFKVSVEKINYALGNTWEVCDLPENWYINSEGKVLETSYCGENGELVFDDSGAVLLQFTGLFDKYNKQIFEGDFLKQRNYKGVVEVVFHNGGWRKKALTPKGIRYYPLYDYDDITTDKMMLGNAEIIGNIYENPELLEKK